MKNKILITAISLLIIAAGTTAFVALKPNSKATTTAISKQKCISSLYISKQDNYDWTKSAGIKIPITLTNPYTEAVRKFYLENYGLKFYTQAEVEKIARDNNMQFGMAEDFIPEIPVEHFNKIETNYKKISTELLYFSAGQFAGEIATDIGIKLCENDFIKIPEKLTQDIQINEWIKPEAIKKYNIIQGKYFNIAPFGNLGKIRLICPPDAFIHRGPLDPIAIVPVHDGWVELDRW